MNTKESSNCPKYKLQNKTVKEVFRINWQAAIKEAENYMNKAAMDDNFDVRLKAASIFCSVKNMYGSDNADAYLELLDENRALLKG